MAVDGITKLTGPTHSEIERLRSRHETPAEYLDALYSAGAGKKSSNKSSNRRGKSGRDGVAHNNTKAALPQGFTGI